MPEGKNEFLWKLFLEFGIWMLLGRLGFGLSGAGRYLSDGMSINLCLILYTKATLSIFLRCLRVGSSNFLAFQ